MIRLKTLPLELIIWIGALTFLYCSNPYAEQASICILKFSGFNYCPGCGLGKSVSLLMHGKIQESLNTHWLGLFAFIVILQRIFILTKIYLNNNRRINTETN